MTPLAAMTSASLTLATVTPMAPAAIWRWVMAGHLCPLACGRHCTPCWRMVPAMCAMLRSIVSMSTSSAGVSSALTGIPTSVVSM